MLIDHHEIFSDITFSLEKRILRRFSSMAFFRKMSLGWSNFELKFLKILEKMQKSLFQFFYKVPNKRYKQIKVFKNTHDEIKWP